MISASVFHYSPKYPKIMKPSAFKSNKKIHGSNDVTMMSQCRDKNSEIKKALCGIVS